MIIRQCVICGKNFQVEPSNPKKTCGPECSKIYRGQRLKERYSNCPKQGYTKMCPICGKIFYTHKLYSHGKLFHFLFIEATNILAQFIKKSQVFNTLDILRPWQDAVRDMKIMNFFHFALPEILNLQSGFHLIDRADICGQIQIFRMLSTYAFKTNSLLMAFTSETSTPDRSMLHGIRSSPSL